MTKSIQRVTLAFLLAFLLLALILGRWSLASTVLTARDDNPRRVFQEEEIQRGAIVDRNDRVLAETIPLSNTLIRHYPDPSAAPVVGYDSINYGQAGIEEAADRLLRGPYDFVDQLLHHRQVGQNVRTTIDAATQALAMQHLTQPGAVVVLALPDGAVRALASNPSFDPNTLDQNWKTLSTDPSAPLLNRATQGLYQPGAILESVLLAEALDAGTIELTQTLTLPDRPFPLNDLTLTCARQATVNTWADAYANACPAPFAELGVTLGEAQLISITQRWQLDQPPPLELRTSAAPTLTFDLSTTEALQAYAVGQSELTVSPLRMALVAATIGNDGVPPRPYVIDAVQSRDGEWAAYEHPDSMQPGEPLISILTAKSLIAAMPTTNKVAGQGGAATSGQRQISWFIGLAPNDRPQYAIAVLLEDTTDPAAAEELGRSMLEELLRE